MALPTLPHRPTRGTETAAAPAGGLPASARELLLIAPMLLFAHGILLWVDDLGRHGHTGVLWFLAQAALIASAFSFVGLAAGLHHVVGHAGRHTRPLSTAALSTAALVAAIAGTGLTAWVALVRGVGGATATVGAPGWLLVAGPVLIGAALLALLALARAALRVPVRTLVLAAAGAALLASPWDLIPLAAIVVLLGLEPLLGGDPAALEGSARPGAR